MAIIISKDEDGVTCLYRCINIQEGGEQFGEILLDQGKFYFLKYDLKYTFLSSFL